MSNTPLAKYSKSKNTEYEEYSASKIIRNLIEFSINDSANKISIKIERNGLSLIEIKNNGNGLSSKDLAESVGNNSVILNNNQNIFLPGDEQPSYVVFSFFTLNINLLEF